MNHYILKADKWGCIMFVLLNTFCTSILWSDKFGCYFLWSIYDLLFSSHLSTYCWQFLRKSSTKILLYTSSNWSHLYGSFNLSRKRIQLSILHSSWMTAKKSQPVAFIFKSELSDSKTLARAMLFIPSALLVYFPRTTFYPFYSFNHLNGLIILSYRCYCHFAVCINGWLNAQVVFIFLEIKMASLRDHE